MSGDRALLAGVRVLDVGDRESDGVTRVLADLGADVLKVEPPGGSAMRTTRPAVAGVGVEFLLGNANKRSVALDPRDPGDVRRFGELVAGADILVDGRGGVAAFGTSCRTLAERFDQLIAVSVTDFGTTGPRAHWQATDAQLCAMSTALSRSGPTVGTPVLPPVGLASGTAHVQAAWAALVAYADRTRCGRGQFIDFSRYEAVVQALDPPFGSEGQAATGLKRSTELWRGRPRNQQIYPTFRCADGHVRLCLLSARQWRGMRAWLGEPEQFADPKFETIAARYGASEELNAAIAELFAPHTMADLVGEGQSRGVPIAAVLTPAEALRSEHFRAVGALTTTDVGGAELTIPVGPFVVDGTHTGYRRPPASPERDIDWVAEPFAPAMLATAGAGRPLAGLRILDLGVIVAGGELGRLFGDLGAEVIKVESATYPDGLRQTPPGAPMSRSWALTHRNQYSLGLDLRSRAGADLFRRLVAQSDAVFANFKPGTLAALGFSYDVLRELNPRIVLAESSAYGASGPWSVRMGYGPLVRAATGVARLWTDASAPGGFFDATTIFPDHVAARLTALGALAALLDRDRSGRGTHIHISQAEAAVSQLAAHYVTEAAREAGLAVDEGVVAHGVSPCAGDDEWCAISVRDDADRAALATAMGVNELPSDAAARTAAVSAWTTAHANTDVADVLQRAGVPAAPMQRAVDVLADPQLVNREVFTEMIHPLFAAPMPTETSPARCSRIPPAPLRPAPMPGEHTREICSRLLGLSAARIDELLVEGVVFDHR
ncbi:CoA transferase [Mycobacterium sp. PS03-16]|uniref:CaiB/BaiF CoA-transferase family protein n=1 Tax=Mycobacterium sp. PS03-16 TaxID=2559611 RepID=UPI0010736D76|nr:CoA transferase [Mycobacterium sp. PS03-16]TFV58014.1 CoA transferase [Mycobacterium sp. PS03-16]